MRERADLSWAGVVVAEVASLVKMRLVRRFWEADEVVGEKIVTFGGRVGRACFGVDIVVGFGLEAGSWNLFGRSIRLIYGVWIGFCRGLLKTSFENLLSVNGVVRPRNWVLG